MEELFIGILVILILAIAGWALFAPFYILFISLPRLRRRLTESEEELEFLRTRLKKFERSHQASYAPSQPEESTEFQPQQEIQADQTVPTSPSFQQPAQPPLAESAEIKEPEAAQPAILSTSGLDAATPSAPPVLQSSSEEKSRQANLPSSSSSIPPISKPPKKQISWEQFAGVNLLAWLGGFILFLGVAFFLKYSIDNALISPVMRVTLGFITGIVALIGGSWLTLKKKSASSLSLCATGILILYADTFAARALYQLIGVELAFACMVLVSAVAFALAVRFSAQVVAFLGLTGALLTPVLISTGSGNLIGLSSYIFILNIALFAILYFKKWDWLLLPSALGTLLLYLGWKDDFYSSKTAFTFVSVLSLTSIFFSIAYERLSARHGQIKWAQLASVLISSIILMIGWNLATLSPFRDQPFWLFTFTLIVDLCLLWPLFVRSNWGWVQSLAGLFTFILLLIWNFEAGRFLKIHLSNHLYTLLGFYFVFTLLHSIGPVLLQRLRPQVGFTRINAIFPLLGMSLTAIPILWYSELSMAVWPVFALIMFIGLVMAALLGSLLTMLAIVLLGAIYTACWMLMLNTRDIYAMQFEVLGVIGGMALLLMAFSIVLFRALHRNASSLPSQQTKLMIEWLPCLSGVFPFLLLSLLVVQISPQDPSNIFGLGLLILILMLGTGRYLRMEGIGLVAVLSSFTLVWTWYLRSFLPELTSIGLFWCLLFYGVQTVAPFVLNFRRSASSLGWISAALAGPLCFFVVYRMVQLGYPNPYMGLVPAGFAIPPLIMLAYALKKPKFAELASLSEKSQIDPWYTLTENRESMESTLLHRRVLAWLGGVALLMITLIFPAQFERHWLTVAWALEAVALFWLYEKLHLRGLAWTGFALGVTAFVRLALNPFAFDPSMQTNLPILNWYLYAYGLSAGALLIGGWMMSHYLAFKERKPFGSFPAIGSFYTMGTLLLFLLMNIEIADYFSKGSLKFNFASYGGSGNFAEGMAYSIAWALFALGLVIIGILKHLRAARYSGMFLIGITILKLLLIDFSALKQLYRVGATVGVALVLILMSFIYNAYFTSKKDSSHE